MAQPGDSKSSSSGGDEPFRVLVVAASEAIEEPLNQEIDRRARGRTPEVKVVVPALAQTRFEHAAGAVDEGREHAQELLEESLEHAREAGIEADGQVGDADPALAIDDALFGFPADEIIVVTHPDDEGRWMEDDMFERAKAQFEPPISRFVVNGGDATQEDYQGEGIDAPEDDAAPDSHNLPPMGVRDVAGLIFSVLGTFALWIIATSNPDTTRQDLDFDALHLLIAGAATLINLAHVVGLVLFSSVGYRGGVRNFFARTSIYGTAVAVVVSLLLTVA